MSWKVRPLAYQKPRGDERPRNGLQSGRHDVFTIPWCKRGTEVICIARKTPCILFVPSLVRSISIRYTRVLSMIHNGACPSLHRCDGAACSVARVVILHRLTTCHGVGGEMKHARNVTRWGELAKQSSWGSPADHRVVRWANRRAMPLGTAVARRKTMASTTPVTLSERGSSNHSTATDALCVHSRAVT